MQELEILPGDRVFVVFAQVAKIVRIVEIFEPRRVATKFLVVIAYGARVLHAAVDHFLFAVPADLKRDGGHHGGGGDDQHRDHQHQSQENIAVFSSPTRPAGGRTRV